jgi:hypothetical protein
MILDPAAPHPGEIQIQVVNTGKRDLAIFEIVFRRSRTFNIRRTNTLNLQICLSFKPEA